MSRHGPARADRAPDLASSIDTWRAWRVVDTPHGYRLASVYKSTLWPPGKPLVADCFGSRSSFNRLFRRGVHEAPATRCECGIYGAGLHIVDECLGALSGNYDVGRVIGEVSLWGAVIECERGYRASAAYPRRIYVPLDGARDDLEDLVLGLGSYGVPVELLPFRCADAIEALLRRDAAGGDLSIAS